MVRAAAKAATNSIVEYQKISKDNKMGNKSFITKVQKDIIDNMKGSFLSRYMGGFYHPEIEKAKKKYQIDKTVERAKRDLSLDNLNAMLKGGAQEGCEDLRKFISHCAMVSTFEKIAFSNYAKSYNGNHRDCIEALKQMLHGDQEEGFTKLAEILKKDGLNKWTIITSFLSYHNPDHEVFIKPTTVKLTLKALKIEDFKYQTALDYSFYSNYRGLIQEAISLLKDIGIKDAIEAEAFFFLSTAPQEQNRTKDQKKKKRPDEGDGDGSDREEEALDE